MKQLIWRHTRLLFWWKIYLNISDLTWKSFNLVFFCSFCWSQLCENNIQYKTIQKCNHYLLSILNIILTLLLNLKYSSHIVIQLTKTSQVLQLNFRSNQQSFITIQCQSSCRRSCNQIIHRLLHLSKVKCQFNVVTRFQKIKCHFAKKLPTSLISKTRTLNKGQIKGKSDGDYDLRTHFMVIKMNDWFSPFKISFHSSLDWFN